MRKDIELGRVSNYKWDPRKWFALKYVLFEIDIVFIMFVVSDWFARSIVAESRHFYCRDDWEQPRGYSLRSNPLKWLTPA